MIRVKNLTKDYGKRKGVFDISFEVNDGEVFGFLGPEGAGKTTTIRQLLGFEVSSRGRCFVNGKNPYVKAEQIHEFTGYLPAKEALPGQMTGLGFLQFMAEMRGIKSIERGQELAKHFDIDIELQIRKMNKEMRHKLSIVSAFMHEPKVYLLDEPMNGLDRTAKHKLDNLILEEKSKGKPILITAADFGQIEHICDRVGLIKKGSIVKTDEIAGFRAVKKISYIVSFDSEREARRFMLEDFTLVEVTGRQVTVSLTGEMTPLIKKLGEYQVVGVEIAHQSLDKVFEYYYGGYGND